MVVLPAKENAEDKFILCATISMRAGFLIVNAFTHAVIAKTCVPDPCVYGESVLSACRSAEKASESLLCKLFVAWTHASVSC